MAGEVGQSAHNMREKGKGWQKRLVQRFSAVCCALDSIQRSDNAFYHCWHNPLKDIKRDSRSLNSSD